MIEKLYKESPFYPGKPVPPEYFYAREAEIRKIIRVLNQSSFGRIESLFVEGERGIGKSSLAEFIKVYAEKELKFLATHCYSGGAKSLEDLAKVLFEKLFSDITEKNIFDKLKDLFQRYIKGLSLFGIRVEFTKDREDLRGLMLNLSGVVSEIYNSIKNEKKGILLIFDDLNGIADTPEFSPLMKSFVDSLSPSKIPLTLVFVGLPERRYEMTKHQESVARIFDIIDLQPFTELESEQFLINNFEQMEITIDDEALNLMVTASGGFPMFLHEIGDSVFELTLNDFVDLKTAINGILGAADRIGKRYIDKQIIKKLKSDTYQSILRIISEYKLRYTFSRSELIRRISGEGAVAKTGSVDNFLKRIKKLGLIIDTETRGEYRFINKLYHLYVMMLAFSKEKHTEK